MKKPLALTEPATKGRTWASTSDSHTLRFLRRNFRTGQVVAWVRDLLVVNSVLIGSCLLQGASQLRGLPPSGMGGDLLRDLARVRHRPPFLRSECGCTRRTSALEAAALEKVGGS